MNDAVLEQLGTLVSIVIFDPLGECLVLQNGHNFDVKLTKIFVILKKLASTSGTFYSGGGRINKLSEAVSS